MIRNVVFDFGQVMIHFEPDYMVGQYVTDPADAKLLSEVVFDRAYWDRLDEGTITDEDVLSGCFSRLPERLWQSAEDIYKNWIYHIPPMDGMAELVQELKDAGYSVYLLSNISRYFVNHRAEIPVLSLFQKCIFSSDCGLVKPDAAIFKHLCDSCQILPEETAFVDDNPGNIAGATQFGIRGILFDGDASHLRKTLKAILAE